MNGMNDFKKSRIGVVEIIIIINAILFLPKLLGYYNIFDALVWGPSSGTVAANTSTNRVRVQSVLLNMEMPYDCIGAVVNLVNRLKGRILNMNQAERVEVKVLIRSSAVPSLEESIKAISGDITTSISK